MPLRGATIDITTASLYVNDRWAAGPRLTFDLGAALRARAQRRDRRHRRRRRAARSCRASARRYDLTGDGKTIAPGAPTRHYAGQVQRRAVLAQHQRRQCRSLRRCSYTGPAGEGRDFAAGFDPANYTTIVSGTFPTANVFFDDDLRSPLTREFTRRARRASSASAATRARPT